MVFHPCYSSALDFSSSSTHLRSKVQLRVVFRLLWLLRSAFPQALATPCLGLLMESRYIHRKDAYNRTTFPTYKNLLKSKELYTQIKMRPSKKQGALPAPKIRDHGCPFLLRICPWWEISNGLNIYIEKQGSNSRTNPENPEHSLVSISVVDTNTRTPATAPMIEQTRTSPSILAWRSSNATHTEANNNTNVHIISMDEAWPMLIPTVVYPAGSGRMMLRVQPPRGNFFSMLLLTTALRDRAPSAAPTH